MEFNKEQQEVIEASNGIHLVLAPPGCGKTAVLAERIVWAHEHGVAFEQMACLTFTNRASRGMYDRIRQRMGDVEGIDELFVGNVHRFCSHFLFQNGIIPEHASVIDTDTSISIIADFLGEDELKVLSEAKHRQRYSQIINLQHFMYQCEHHYPKELTIHRDALGAQIFKELCTAFHLECSRESAIDLYRHADFYREEHALLSSDANNLLTALYAASCYERYKHRNDLLDFEDLLLFTYDYLSASPTPCYSWLQIDEVQDLNPLQLAIIDLFATPDATIIYLGDAQQAIFSFMGAKTDTLKTLYQRAGKEGFHNFFHNYRSPQYLLNVFNTYAEQQLNIAPDLLPSTQNETPQRQGDLVLTESETNIDEVNLVARMARRLYEAYPNETTAVVVAFNSDADDISAALTRLPHFKVSGTDLFATPEVRTLLAHLCVAGMEQNFIAWSQLFTGLHIYSSQSASRKFIHDLMELSISPVDLLTYENSTYIAEFAKAYGGATDFVVFDTETTGLNIFEDDVVQIAAIRVREGKVIDELSLFIETDKVIPEMLGNVTNPLIEEYARQPHVSHREGMEQFVAFAKGCHILGHNATYDYQIMEHNMRRYCPELSMKVLWPNYFDSLKIIRLLRPRLKSYKLKSLLESLQLEGQNSHLANDDIIATLSLVDYCYNEARPLIERQMDFISHHQQTIEKFKRLYLPLFKHTNEALYIRQEGNILSDELRYTYHYLREEEKIGIVSKLDYIIDYINIDLLTPESGNSLSEQLSRHLQDLTTLKEADLCGAASMKERVFISTVHKAKGLEFDNVIVFDAVEGKYPSAYADTTESNDEEARKFYVALSRARRRLVITYCHHSVTRYGRWFEKKLSPYMNSIKKFF